MGETDLDMRDYEMLTDESFRRMQVEDGKVDAGFIGHVLRHKGGFDMGTAEGVRGRIGSICDVYIFSDEGGALNFVEVELPRGGGKISASISEDGTIGGASATFGGDMIDREIEPSDIIETALKNYESELWTRFRCNPDFQLKLLANPEEGFEELKRWRKEKGTFRDLTKGREIDTQQLQEVFANRKGPDKLPKMIGGEAKIALFGESECSLIIKEKDDGGYVIAITYPNRKSFIIGVSKEGRIVTALDARSDQSTDQSYIVNTAIEAMGKCSIDNDVANISTEEPEDRGTEETRKGAHALIMKIIDSLRKLGRR